MTQSTLAYVIVTGTASDGEDEAIPGVYEVAIVAAAPVDLHEEIAIEAFHDSFGVEVLDDFSIRAVDADGNAFTAQREGDDIRGTVDLAAWIESDAEPVDAPEFAEGTLGARLVAELDGDDLEDGDDANTGIRPAP